MNDALLTPLQFSLPAAIDSRNQDKFQIGSKAVPCTITKINGELVEVKFEIASTFTLPKVVIPQAFSEWIRQPTQVGDKGYAVPADYYLGGQSGIGGGTANLYPKGNLTPLVFVPLSQSKFANNTNRNLNAVFINGPEGAVIQDTAGKCVMTLSQTGLVLTIGGVTVTINASGLDVEGGDIVNNTLTVGSTHVHGGVTAGGDNTGPPNP